MTTVRRQLFTFAFILSAATAPALQWIPDRPDEAAPPSASRASDETTSEVIPPFDWVESLDKALERARERGKPVLIEFHVTYHGWCRMFDEKTLSEPAIVRLSGKFVCVRINGNDAPDLARKYGVKSYPTIVFLNAKGEVIDRQIGLIAPRPFETQMKEIAAGREPEKEFRALVESNPRDFRSLVLLGIGWLRREEWDKATEAYEKALAVGPGLDVKAAQEVVYSLCPLYDLRGKPEKAERLLLELMRAPSADRAKVHDLLGHTYVSLKRFDDAIWHFRAERDLATDQKQREMLERLIEKINEARNQK
ncbi:thioredoxin family protein [Candidatus Sumerlaeota bacterium]|nr:thioredoxin family protein [Candidatus Sumerlaeota bacterium]